MILTAFAEAIASAFLLAGAPATDAITGQPLLESLNPRALELFDREPVLKAWALRSYDRNHDGWLTLYEAQAAADSFRDVADGNRDGRVSMTEYAAALDFIRARY